MAPWQQTAYRRWSYGGGRDVLGLKSWLYTGHMRFEDSSLPPSLSVIQFQVSDVFLDPGLFEVSANLPVSLGQENDTWLGAKTAGLKIVSDEFAWNL